MMAVNNTPGLTFCASAGDDPATPEAGQDAASAWKRDASVW